MKILFQGDSITDAGRSRTAAEANRGLGDGYVNLIAAELTGKAPGRYEIFNRGVGGNRMTPQDLARRGQVAAMLMRFLQATV